MRKDNGCFHDDHEVLVRARVWSVIREVLEISSSVVSRIRVDYCRVTCMTLSSDHVRMESTAMAAPVNQRCIMLHRSHLTETAS